MRRLSGLTFALVAVSLFAGHTAAQTPADGVTTVDEIVVVARRSGAPIWEVSDGSATVILVGDLRAVPEATPWDPSALQEAVGRVDRVMLDTRVRGSASDILRLIWRMRTISRLPNGTTSADYLTPEDQARLDALEARYRQDYSRSSFLATAFDLLRQRLEFQDDAGVDASEVVERAARRARKPVRAVEGGRGDELIDNLITAPPETHRPCLLAAMAATEAGRAGVLQRGEDWTRLRVPEVRRAPLQIALERCWPWGDPTTGPQLKAAWMRGVDAALDGDEVVMAVAPIGLLAEPDGLLDRLEAQGLVIDGPIWKD